MTAIAPTRLFVNGIEAHGIEGAPIRITIPRGFDWRRSVFTITLGRERPEDEALLQEYSEVTLKLECADPANLGQAQSVELKKYWVISRRVREDGFVVYELANNFWRNQHNKLTASYNILSYGGKYRPDSIPGAFFQWRTIEAVKDALKKCGYEVEDNPKLDGQARQVKLPDNLSNAEGGGWAAAPQELWGPSMLDSAACDVVQTPAGKVMIVDRVTQVYDDALFSPEYVKFSGEVNEASVEWQKPPKIVFSFQRRIERRAEYTEADGTTSGSAFDPTLENVIPNWQPNGTTAVADHTEFSSYVRTYFFAVTQILKRFLRKTMFDVHGNFTAALLDQYRVIEGMVRQVFRRRFRFKPYQDSSDDIRTKYAMVEFGRLQSDGSSKPGGVYMDYVKDKRFGETTNPDDNPLTAKFSENVPVNVRKPAPFTASWLPGAQDDLVFTVDADTPDSRSIVGYIPGRLTAPKSYGDSIHDAIRGKAPLQLDDNVDLSSAFTMYVYWHGLWVHNGKGVEARLYEEKLTLFKGGKAPVLYYPLIQDMTANYRFKESSGGEFPGDLINGGDILRRCRQLEAEVRQSFQQKRSGIAFHAGLDVVSRGNLWVNGDVHELEFEVHGRTVGSLETHVTVLPGARAKATPVVTGPRAQGDLPARFL